jgi:hypothetical protein
VRRLSNVIFCSALIWFACGELPSFAQQNLSVTQKRDATKALTPSEMLSELRDFRLCLTQLKQQSVNLFQEATRTMKTEADTPLETTPDVVSASMLDETKQYLPPRKEWLVFYVNTLEPIVGLLCEDVKDTDTNGHSYSKEIEDRVNPLWKAWKDDVKEINLQLDKIQELIAEDSGSNVPLAKAAIAIYNDAENLEKARYQAALIFKEEFTKMKSSDKK